MAEVLKVLGEKRRAESGAPLSIIEQIERKHERERQAGKPKEASNEAVTQVPILKIFEIELAATKPAIIHETEWVSAYDRQVNALKDAIREKWPSTHITKIPERDLFKFTAEFMFTRPAFLLQAMADLERGINPGQKAQTLIGCLGANTLNCYATTVIAASAFTELGKSITIILSPNHVLLAGEKYTIDTAAPGLRSVVDKSNASPEQVWDGMVREKSSFAPGYLAKHELGIDKLTAVTYNNIVLVFFENGDAKGVIDAADRAMQAYPAFPEPLMNKAIALHVLGKVDEALGIYDSVLRTNPSHPFAHYGKGTIYYVEKRWDAALACMDASLKLNPDFAPAHLGKGMVLRHLGREKEADAEFREACDIRPAIAENLLKDAKEEEKFGRVEIAKENRELADYLVKKGWAKEPSFVATIGL